jgi:shikimate kinase
VTTEPSAKPAQSILLIGYRGSGKSTVGVALAKKLGRPFFDTDQQIIHAQGQTIRAIFEQRGEPSFRDLETQTLQALVNGPPAVIACGGGITLRPENQQLLRQIGTSIWLRAPAEELFRRINDDAISHDHRPPLTDHAGIAEVEHLLAVREATYAAAAAWTVDVAGRTVETIVEEITHWLGEQHL